MRRRNWAQMRVEEVRVEKEAKRAAVAKIKELHSLAAQNIRKRQQERVGQLHSRHSASGTGHSGSGTGRSASGTGRSASGTGRSAFSLQDQLLQPARAKTPRARGLASGARRKASGTRRSASGTRRSASHTRHSASGTRRLASRTRRSASHTRRSASGSNDDDHVAVFEAAYILRPYDEHKYRRKALTQGQFKQYYDNQFVIMLKNYFPKYKVEIGSITWSSKHLIATYYVYGFDESGDESDDDFSSWLEHDDDGYLRPDDPDYHKYYIHHVSAQRVNKTPRVGPGWPFDDVL